MQEGLPKDSPNFKFGLTTDLPLHLARPLFSSRVSCGFPSPADECVEDVIDLNDYLIKNKYATFYARAEGVSMRDDFIVDRTLLVIDKSIPYHPDSIMLCYYEGDFTVKRVLKRGSEVYLVPSNPEVPEILVTRESELVIWGTVTFAINQLHRW
jgi:DNA polymerase V